MNTLKELLTTDFIILSLASAATLILLGIEYYQTKGGSRK